MYRIFGAETGDTKEASLVSGGSVTSSFNSGGAYAYSCTNVDQITFDLAGSFSTVYIRFALKMSGVGTGGPISCFLVQDSSSVSVANVGAKWNAALGVWSITARTFGGTASAFCADIPSGTPAVVQVKVVTGTGSNCTCTVLVNGETLVSSNGTATTSITKVAIAGINAGFPVLFDDIAVSDTGYPGPGFVLARQFKSGTPTYNTFGTKTGGAIVVIWSNTPASTASFAAATAANQAQTALVSSFSATQSGHGTGVIAASDIINAVKVGAVGKRGTGGATTHTLRFRYNSINSDSADWTAITTTDAYVEFYPPGPFTPTLLNASEAGGVQGSAATQLFTVEDVWVMMDYTPVAAPVGKLTQVRQAIHRSSYY